MSFRGVLATRSPGTVNLGPHNRREPQGFRTALAAPNSRIVYRWLPSCRLHGLPASSTMGKAFGGTSEANLKIGNRPAKAVTVVQQNGRWIVTVRIDDNTVHTAFLTEEEARRFEAFQQSKHDLR